MKNKLLTLLFLITAASASAQMPVEGFEGETFPPEGWSVYDNGIGTEFSWGTIDLTNPFYPPYEGDYAAFIDNENVPDGTVAQDWLVTPLVEVTGTVPVIRFFSRQTLNSNQGGIYKIMMSTDADPSNLAAYTVLQQWTEPELNPDAAVYKEIFVPIPVEMVGEQAYFAFVMEGDNADRWLIDNVSFLEYYCPQPTNFSITSASFDTATISWTGNGQTLWEVEVVPAGTAPIGEGVVVSEASYTAEGLDMGQYAFYVKAICSETEESAWAGPYYFNNLNSFDGTVSYDSDGDEECDAVLQGIEVIMTIDDEQFSVYTNEDGYYTFNNIAYETANVSIQIATPDGFDEEVYEAELDFSAEEDIAIDFCLGQPDPVNDLAVTLVPVLGAQPGFTAKYKLVVKNNGTTIMSSATATLTFDDVKLDFDEAQMPYTLSGNTVTFTFNDLQPFTTHTRTLQFYLLPPPENVGGEILEFIANVTPEGGDNTPEDNSNILNQETVNSYDPNDITVHEGSEIQVEQAGEYLHYTIRFQNTGTAPAVNVRLDNLLDENLDASTFEMITSSHNCTVSRNGNELEFMHSEIYLANESADESGSHGYVTYRVKPISGFDIGDIAYNTAGIYFDFNPVIETNLVSTEVVNTMDTESFNMDSVRLYPNPVKDRLYIQAQEAVQSVEIYDINGRLCQTHLNVQNGIYTAKLAPGLYLVKIKSEGGSGTLKFIKE